MTKVLAKNIDRFVETEIDEETVVMDLDSGSFFSLRESARAIWLLIDGTRSRDAILAALAAEYEAPEAELAIDLDGFIATLRDAGLITGG